MATQRWNIDPSHSSVNFTVRHMVISKVRGAFGRFEGALDFDPENPAASKAQVRIETASIDTREAKRDEHLRSGDFFAAEKYPALTFQSTKVEKTDGDQYRVSGNLTIRDTTRPVVLEAEFLGGGKDPWGNERIGFSAHTSINRKEFGLTWNQALETGGLLVGEKIEIAIDVEAVRAQAAQKA